MKKNVFALSAVQVRQSNNTMTRRFILILHLVFLTQFIFAQTYKLSFKGDKRKYLVHLPKGYNATKKYPLVLNFHGLGGDPKQEQKYSGMNPVADKEGFIVIYPKGIGRFWNTGVGKKSYIGSRDDVGFVNLLLDTLFEKYSIDTKRVYSTGMSLGGYFSYRLACTSGNRFAAIASVTGVLSDSTEVNCDSKRNIPVLQIHGTKDPIVKYGGMKQSNGAEETVRFWTKRNKCTSAADTLHLPDNCPKDKSTATLIKFKSCNNGSEVWFCQIQNGGHTWPGTRKNYLFLGKTNRDFSASKLVWDFFKNFKLEEIRE